MTDDSENSSKQEVDVGIMPKVETLNYDLPSENIYSRIMADNVASSSGSNTRSSFIEMGFSPFLVDRAIRENGEDNVDRILETLFTYSDSRKPKLEHFDSDNVLLEDNNKLPADCGARQAFQISDSSDSLNSLFGDDDEICSHSNHTGDIALKEEPDADSIVSEKKASLLAMNFSKNEVEFAMDKLGVDSPISELVDFIFAARIADNYAKGANNPSHRDVGKDQVFSSIILIL